MTDSANARHTTSYGADGGLVAHAIPVEMQFVAVRLTVHSELLHANLTVDLIFNLRASSRPDEVTEFFQFVCSFLPH
jgi:hypothetical protein